MRGFKRTAPVYEPENAKKARAWKVSHHDEEEGRHEGKEEEDDEEEEDDDENDNETDKDESVATPRTSRSASLPRYPSNLKTIPCTFDGCKKFFNRQAKLIQHLRSHTDTRPFLCPHLPCTKAYLRDTHLQHHIKSAHSQIRDYVCTLEGCGKAFATGTRYRRHVAAHEGNTKTCTVDGCGQVFRKHSTLEAHIQKVHQGLKAYFCQYLDIPGNMCGMGFDTTAQLRSHEGRVHSRNTFECTICLPSDDSNIRRSFPTYGALQEHIKIDHPPTCNLCGLACATKSSLKSHFEIRHGGTAVEGRKMFTCPEDGCGRGFSKKGNMNTHIDSAHKQQRYVCGGVNLNDFNNVDGWDGLSACGAGFASKANLEKHIRISHVGSLKEVSRSRWKTALKAKTAPADHERAMESLDEELSCTVLGCGTSFQTTYDLSSHLQTRHGLAEYEVRAMILPANNTGNGVVRARPGFPGATVAFATADDLDAEAAFDDMQAHAAATAAAAASELNITINSGDSEHQEDHTGQANNFWLGGVSSGEAADGNVMNEWAYDEQEMRRLISDDLNDMEDGLAQGEEEEEEVNRDAMDIDPVLL